MSDLQYHWLTHADLPASDALQTLIAEQLAREGHGHFILPMSMEDRKATMDKGARFGGAFGSGTLLAQFIAKQADLAHEITSRFDHTQQLPGDFTETWYYQRGWMTHPGMHGRHIMQGLLAWGTEQLFDHVRHPSHFAIVQLTNFKGLRMAHSCGYTVQNVLRRQKDGKYFMLLVRQEHTVASIMQAHSADVLQLTDSAACAAQLAGYLEHGMVSQTIDWRTGRMTMAMPADQTIAKTA